MVREGGGGWRPLPPCAPFIYGPAIAVESVLSPPHQPKPPFFKG